MKFDIEVKEPADGVTKAQEFDLELDEGQIEAIKDYIESIGDK